MRLVPSVDPTPSHSNAELIDRLQTRINDVLEPLLSAFGSFVLFDVPVHNNVGDSAMFLGELEYLERHHSAPAYMCRGDRCDYGRLSSRYEDSLILIQGGGNFGDIWPGNHGFRETLLEQCKGRPIVQFPQTVKFYSETALQRTRDLIRRHGEFTLLVRDQPSFDFARHQFECDVILCPDMAFCLGPLDRRGVPAHDLLLLAREDRESASANVKPNLPQHLSARIADWPAEGRSVRAARKATAFSQSVFREPLSLLHADTARNAFLARLAQNRLEIGLNLLSCGKYLITDRLHACILSLLLDVPRSIIDNSYGKLSGFMDTWIDDAAVVPAFETVNDAIFSWAALDSAKA